MLVSELPLRLGSATPALGDVSDEEPDEDGALLAAGYATLTIPEIVTCQGRAAYHIVAEARSKPFFNAIFRVHDVLDSYLDVQDAFSLGYAKNIQEGRFRSQASYVYDQRRGLILEPAKGTSAPIPFGTQDVLSCYYYFRTLPMAVGSHFEFPVTADDMKTYDLSVDVLRRERIHTLAGDFDCLAVRPHLSFKGVFRQKGRVLLWVTDDERRIPVLVRSRIVIGSIEINLVKADRVATGGQPDGQKQGR